MQRILVSAVVVMLSWGSMPAQAGEAEFPLRPRYPDVPVISTQDLSRRLGDVLVVDVRSKYEYDTLHVQGAVNLPLAGRGFGDALAKLRQGHNQPLVFYCNGKTCAKSYDAVLEGQHLRIPDLLAYDAGIVDWAASNPDKTVLLGRSPISPADLITPAKFNAHLLEARDFEAMVGNDSIVLDVRDRAQRDTPLFPFKERRAQLDETAILDAAIADAKAQKKTLLVYDAVGKQVEWFQYRIEAKGLKDYYFLKGGSHGYFETTLGKVELGHGQATPVRHQKTAAK